MSLPLFGPAQLLQGVVQFSLSPFVHAVLVHAVSLPSRLVQPGLSKDPRRKRRGFNKEGLYYVGGICPPNPLTRMPFLPTASSGASWHDFVKRQWCGHRGKVDNCQVGVFMGYVSRHDHALLDFRLYLPQEWARDEQRRHACHVPLEVQYQTRQEQCLEMLDKWGDHVPHGWVTGDDELGRHT